jgi:hypothetical protein
MYLYRLVEGGDVSMFSSLLVGRIGVRMFSMYVPL